MRRKQYQEYLAVTIYMGVITIINDKGNLESYRQRGIYKLSQQQFDYAVTNGLLRGDIMGYPELPANYKIAFESEEISGRADSTFKMPR